MRTLIMRAVHENALGSLAAGVGASARLNPALGHPVYLGSARGSRLFAADGTELLDLNMSLGAAMLGHGDPAVREAVAGVLDAGLMCAHETPAHVIAAEKLCALVPAAERIRFANSGTEANQVAVRLARAHTGRTKLLKFEGHFHGLHDYWMFNTTAGGEPLIDGAFVPLAPESAGIPPAIYDDLLVIPWNDPDAFERAMRLRGDQLAAVLCEPVNYNSGCIPPEPGFLELVRDLTREYGALLIFDEILSGFRMAPGGAQAHYGVTPDLCTLGKALGNGVPVSVVAGSADVMHTLAPSGASAHSGTYTGHPLAVAAVNATLDRFADLDFYQQLDDLSAHLVTGLQRLFTQYGHTVRIQSLGARFGLYWGIDRPVRSYRDCTDYDAELAMSFSRSAYRAGLYVHSYGRIALGHHGISAAHTRADIDEALNRVDDALKEGL